MMFGTASLAYEVSRVGWDNNCGGLFGWTPVPMPNPKLTPGDEVLIRAEVTRIWPNGEITVFIKSATAGGKLTLIDDRDVVPQNEKGPASRS